MPVQFAATPGFWLVRLAIWLAIAAWLSRVFLEACRRPVSWSDRFVRVAWVVGAVATLGHVILAIVVAHNGSLSHAMRHTAEVTRQVIGVELPWSVFVNLAFVAYWLADAIRELRLNSVPRLGVVRHTIWFVMMFNATVVFGPSYWWLVSIPILAAYVFVRQTTQ